MAGTLSTLATFRPAEQLQTFKGVKDMTEIFQASAHKFADDSLNLNLPNRGNVVVGDLLGQSKGPGSRASSHSKGRVESRYLNTCFQQLMPDPKHLRVRSNQQTSKVLRDLGFTRDPKSPAVGAFET